MNIHLHAGLGLHQKIQLNPKDVIKKRLNYIVEWGNKPFPSQDSFSDTLYHKQNQVLRYRMAVVSFYCVVWKTTTLSFVVVHCIWYKNCKHILHPPPGRQCINLYAYLDQKLPFLTLAFIVSSGLDNWYGYVFSQIYWSNTSLG